MGSKWPRVCIADVCEMIVDCVNKTAPVVEHSTNFKMIRTPNIKSGRVSTEECRFVTEETFDKWTRRAKVLRNDVLLTREAPLGEVGIVNTDENIFLGQRIMQYRTDTSKLDPHFLLYSFLSPDLQHQFSMHEGSGSVVSHIRVGDCSKFELNLPPLDEQKRIAETLRNLDSKIETNRQINQTLEQMAQTLFKSWFVDFDPVIDNALDAGNEIPEPLQARAELRQKIRASQDFQPLPADVRALFPAEFEESELGWVPKGWKASNVGNEFDVTMGQSPPGDTYNENSIGIPFFQGKTDFGFRFPSNRVYCTDPKRLANKNDTLISVRAPVGDTNLAASDCCIGRGIAAVRHKSGSVSFTYYAINNLAKHFEVYEGEGTVFGSINQKDMNSLPQLAVPKNCIFFFDKYAGDWDKKIELAAKEVEQLTQLRDTLLPKLISGELRLDDLPDEVVTAANE